MSIDQKPIAFVGGNGRIERYSTLSSADLFARSGFNLGNSAFQYALHGHIADACELVPFNFVPGELRERYRLICLPVANYLYSQFDFADLAVRLEATGLPLLVIGLGIQATESLNEVVLKPGTQRLLSLFAERCKTIMVRGEMTGAFLESQGINNFEALGCPSNFLSPRRNLGASIARQVAAMAQAPPERIAFAPTFYPHNMELEAKLTREIGEALSLIVVQEPLEAVALARGRRHRGLLRWWNDESGFPSSLQEEHRSRLLSLLIGFFSVDSWIEAYRRNDLVVGTRVHGVSLAWQAGRPAVLVVHDLRTRELACTMGLPLIAPDEAMQDGLLGRATALIEATAADYDARRQVTAEQYVELLRRHGVTPTADLLLLAVNSPHLRCQAEQNETLAAPAPQASMGFLENYSSHQGSGWVRGETAEMAEVLVAFDGHAPVAVVPDKLRPDRAPDAWQFSIVPPDFSLASPEVLISVVHKASSNHLDNSPAIGRFGAERPEAVLEGRDHVLFLSENFDNGLAQVRGDLILSEQQLTAWRDFLLGFDELALTMGFDGHLLIAPGKEVVLAGYLPEGHAISENRPARQILALADELGLARVVATYPVEVLAAELIGSAFTRGDSHWSCRGAQLAMSSLWYGPRTPPGALRYPADGENWDLHFEPSDLLILQGISSTEEKKVLRRRRLLRQLTTLNNVGIGLLQRHASTDPAAVGSVVMFHDWMGQVLVQPMAEQFLLATTKFSHDMDSELVESASPDVVVFEIAERYLLSPPKLA